MEVGIRRAWESQIQMENTVINNMSRNELHEYVRSSSWTVSMARMSILLNLRDPSCLFDCANGVSTICRNLLDKITRKSYL